MNWFQPHGPGLFERMFGWLVASIAVLVLFEILIVVLIQLLPWIVGFLVIGAVLGLAVRWYLRRYETW